VYWCPKFARYAPDGHDDNKKLDATTITNMLPRMQRLGGPYDMYGTVYGVATAVVHVAHPVPALAILLSRSSGELTSGACKAPAYDHFKNFCGDGVFTAEGNDWKVKRAAVLHALFRVRGGCYEHAVETEAFRAQQLLLCDLDVIANDGSMSNIVPLLQHATIGLIYRYITHSDIDTRLLSKNDDYNDDTVSDSSKQTRTLLTAYLQSISRIRMLILAQSRSIWFLLPQWAYRTFSAMYQDEERTMRPIRKFSKMACENAVDGSPLAQLQQRPVYSKQHGRFSVNLLDEALTLLFAGQDTSAATLSWTLHLLSLYPAAQEKLAHEIKLVLPELTDSTILTKRLLAKLPYLDAVVKESMRLYAVAPFIVRKLKSDLSFSDDETGTKHMLPKNSLVCIWIYGLHRHPKFWKRPDEFVPERWIYHELKDKGMTSGAYMPFAAGPRNCVGQPLATIILRSFLARLIHRYRFVEPRLSKDTDPESLLKPMQAGFTVLPQGGVNLIVEKR
jgi:hypothetical protein